LARAHAIQKTPQHWKFADTGSSDDGCALAAPLGSANMQVAVERAATNQGIAGNGNTAPR
jgi:hypothetical protein